MRSVLVAALASLLFIGLSGSPKAQTSAEAFKLGCGGCHSSEKSVLGAIPKEPQSERRAWIEKFMSQHPCERDDLKPLIVNYLLEKSAP